MGDYSRDTFQLTNVLHALLSGDTVTDPRHYVSVRLQQGVPVLDADWNELEDIRRRELQTILRYYIGDGVPAGDSGFQITAGSGDNELSIQPGVLLVDGFPTVNLQATSYSGQPQGSGLPALTTPAGGTPRTDLAFLEVWEEEVTGGGAESVDERLINEAVGVETATRRVRLWRVGVRESATDLSGLATEAGHSYLPLARLHRQPGVAAIRDVMIEDLRRRGITLAEHLKVPIDLQRGLEVLDVSRYGAMLQGLNTALFGLLRAGELPYQSADDSAERIVLMALQTLLQRAQAGEVEALNRNMDNRDALGFLDRLHRAQHEWLTIVEQLGNDGGVADEFLAGYRQRLDGAPADPLLTPLRPALDRGDLIESVIAQEEINFWLSATTGDLPEGQVQALYSLALDFEPLVAGNAYRFLYEIVAFFDSPQVEEDFNVQVTLPAAFGTATVDQPALVFSPPGGEATVQVTVTPSGGAPTAELDVAAISVRNATLRSSQPPLTLTLGATPPAASFFFYIGPRLNTEGRLEIPVGHLTRPQGRNVLFRIRNTSAETRTYEVDHRIVPEVGDTTGWAPLSFTAISPVMLAAGQEIDVPLRIDGPKAPDPAPAAGTLGVVEARAVVTLVGGAPPPDPQEPHEITIPFIAV